MDKFEKAINKTLNFEGGYSNHPLDSGGKTNYGITWKTLKNYNGETNVKNITIEIAKTIYKKLYWNPLKCDKFTYKIALELFDAGVNCGIITAGKFFQNALNWLNRNQKTYPDLKIDGKIGNKTISAYNKLTKVDLKILLIAIRGERYRHYRNIVFLNSKQEIFFRSWLRRLA